MFSPEPGRHQTTCVCVCVCACVRVCVRACVCVQGLGISSFGAEDARSMCAGLRSFVQQHNPRAPNSRAGAGGQEARAGDGLAAQGGCQARKMGARTSVHTGLDAADFAVPAPPAKSIKAKLLEELDALMAITKVSGGKGGGQCYRCAGHDLPTYAMDVLTVWDPSSCIFNTY